MSRKPLTESQKSYCYERAGIKNTNPKLFGELLKIYDYKCAMCGFSEPTLDKGKLKRQNGNQLHHIKPYKQGGLTTKENLILLCPKCHYRAEHNEIAVDELKFKQRFTPTNNVSWLKEQHSKVFA
jgi:predicted HNH restriction endonuclease